MILFKYFVILVVTITILVITITPTLHTMFFELDTIERKVYIIVTSLTVIKRWHPQNTDVCVGVVQGVRRGAKVVHGHNSVSYRLVVTRANIPSLTQTRRELHMEEPSTIVRNVDLSS